MLKKVTIEQVNYKQGIWKWPKSSLEDENLTTWVKVYTGRLDTMYAKINELKNKSYISDAKWNREKKLE